MVFEQAVAREALRLAYDQHKQFATTLKGVQQQRTVGDTFSQETGGQSIVDNMSLDLLVASGGVTSLDDVAECKRIGCSGAIIGRAWYEGRIDLAQAIAIAQ